MDNEARRENIKDLKVIRVVNDLKVIKDFKEDLS